MVNCDRCHRKFSSYVALSQHYDRKHPAARKPTYLEDKVSAEREAGFRPRASPYKSGRSTIKLTVFALIIIIAVGVIAYAALNPPVQRGGSALNVGSVAPNFSLPDTSGGTFRLSDFKGKSNVLLFFNEGFGCDPCLRQMHEIDGVSQQFFDMNVTVAGITKDSVESLAQWVRTVGHRYGSVLSDQTLSVSRSYDMIATSMHGNAAGHSFVLVDKSGIIQWRADYGPSIMYVENSEILAAVRNAL